MKTNELQNKLSQTIEHFKKQLAEYRTGSANPSLIENIKVEAYEGSDSMNLNELGTINVVDATLLTVDPWDKSTVEEIEKAIRNSEKGLNPNVDGTTVKVPVPQPTEESRREYIKQAKEKLEEAKISVRNIRQDAIKSCEEQEDKGVISEDEMNRTKNQIEDRVKSTNEELEELFAQKEKELLSI